jgi:predicted PhzF superfamily epimerase YddE/YHI9
MCWIFRIVRWIIYRRAHTPQLFSTRNAFSNGGVYEDPATGASTPVLAGYLRAIAWPHAGCIVVYQGDDIGVSLPLYGDISAKPGASILVSGTARVM